MQLIQRTQGRGEGGEPGRVRYENAEGSQLSNEKGEGAKRIGRYVQFFQANARVQSRRESAEEIGRNVQGQQCGADGWQD